MKPFLLTISREFGSRGHEIGEVIAKKYDVPLYDRNYLDQIAVNSLYLTKNDLSHLDDLTKSGVPIRLWDASDRNLLKSVYSFEENFINRLADEGSCIFVGRCADYILRERTNTLHTFLFAPYGVKLNHLINKYGLTQEGTVSLMNRMDQSRHNYYKYFTRQTRGDRTQKDLVFDSSILGIQGSAELISLMLEGKFGEQT